MTAADWNHRGVWHKQQGRLEEALEAYRQAIAADPSFADAHYNLGNVYRIRQDLASAAACFRRAVEIDPAHSHALAALGQTLHAAGHHEEAVAPLERALSLIPADAGLHCDLADALASLERYPEALDRYRLALQLDPQTPRAWYSAGCVQLARKEFAEAIACHQNAVELAPEWCEARHNLGRALFEMGQVEPALRQFAQAATGHRPELPRAMMAVIVPGSPAADNRTILDVRRAWLGPAAHRPATSAAAGPPAPPKLRIGYVSSFFHRPNWMKPVWGLINRHDRSLFQIHLFSDAPASAIGSAYRPHPEDGFHDLTGLSNQSAAARIAESSIHVLVDLNGYSNLRRLPLFLLRPAPVIAAWFNMYATTGMPCFDYLVGDDTVIPPREEPFYVEKIVRVPGTYLPFEVAYPVPEVAPPPRLAQGEFTFGCLASQYKITGEVVAAWSRILFEAPHSSLLLRNAALGSQANRRFVLRLFEECGIPAGRVRLEGPAPHYEFLQTYNRIDLALDPFPYNGGTTTAEALWQGVPVVAFYGDRWASRTSASILRAAGLEQFVTPGLDACISLAAAYANSPEMAERLAEIRSTIRSRLQGSAACDMPGFARAMERLYLEMARGGQERDRPTDRG